MNKIVIGIVGSRYYNDYATFVTKVEECINKFISGRDIDTPIKIVTGGAIGIDSMVEDWVDNNQGKYKLKVIEADWKNLGKKAGYIRNGDIVEEITHLIALWDHQSKGTKDTINKALKARKIVRIVRIEQDDEPYISKRRKLKMTREHYLKHLHFETTKMKNFIASSALEGINI